MSRATLFASPNAGKPSKVQRHATDWARRSISTCCSRPWPRDLRSRVHAVLLEDGAPESLAPHVSDGAVIRANLAQPRGERVSHSLRRQPPMT